MIRIIVYLATLLFGSILASAQQITGRIIDAQTQESIPFATIRVGENDLISNDDGYFTLSTANSEDKNLLSVSVIGYKNVSVTIEALKQNNYIIPIDPVIYEIAGVHVSNVIPDPLEIIKQAKTNLAKNYTKSDYQSTIFTRESNSFKPKNFEIEIKKSTGFSKSELKEANTDINKFISRALNNPPKSYTDKLMKYYRFKKDDKVNSKLEVLKGIALKDESNSTNFDDLEKKVTDLFLKHLDTTKFYRVKSGLFGSRDTISFSKEYNEKKNSKKKTTETEVTTNNNIKNSKNGLNTIISENSFLKKDQFEFITETDLYTYTYKETTYMGNDLVYVLEFKPKKKKAKYEGTLYINDEDYAILRTDFRLGKGKKLEGLNLKLLLGVKVSNNHHTGTIIYKKNPFNNAYGLQYASIESGQYFYVSRPIKFIELAKSDRDVLSLDFKVEGSNIEKVEFLTISTYTLTESEFDGIEEKEFKYQFLKKYDPSIWKGYNIIEPVAEMKKFEVVE